MRRRIGKIPSNVVHSSGINALWPWQTVVRRQGRGVGATDNEEEGGRVRVRGMAGFVRQPAVACRELR